MICIATDPPILGIVEQEELSILVISPVDVILVVICSPAVVIPGLDPEIEVIFIIVRIV